MELGDARMQRVMDAARRNGIFVVMGYSELAGGTLYISQVFIDDSGEIVANRRKLKPTHVERTLFGEGDGSDLFVTDTAFGRIGGLNCWEHYQALTIFTMTALHEQIHVASWPSNDIFQPAYNQTIDADRNMTSVYAALTQSFVICSTQVIGSSAQAAWELTEDEKDKLPVGGGWAGVYGPDGDELTRAERLAPDVEGILYADIDLNDIVDVKAHLDPVGHYSRPDVFNLHVNTRGNSLVRYSGDGSRRTSVTGDGAITLDTTDAQGEVSLGASVVHPGDHAPGAARGGAEE
jgi:aliphatic nitrilase